MRSIGMTNDQGSMTNKFSMIESIFKSKILKFGIYKLKFIWNLNFEIWNFHCYAVGVPLDSNSNIGAR